jgi:hypothetical protein
MRESRIQPASSRGVARGKKDKKWVPSRLSKNECTV